MERKEILKLIVAIIVLALIAVLPLMVLFTETDTNLRLLASGILLTIFLGGYNMIKSLFRNTVAEELKEANRLKEQEVTLLKNEITRRDKQAKNQLRSCLGDFVSVGSGDNIISLGYPKRKELQKKMSDVGNAFKTAIEHIEKLILLPQDILNEAKDIAKSIINLSQKIARGVMVANEDEGVTKLRDPHVVEEWNALTERAKKLIGKLEQEEVEDKEVKRR